jgi:hypothetical protein
LQIGKALLLDENTVRNDIARFQRGGLVEYRNDNYKGGLVFLNEKEPNESAAHRQKHV